MDQNQDQSLTATVGNSGSTDERTISLRNAFEQIHWFKNLCVCGDTAEQEWEGACLVASLLLLLMDPNHKGLHKNIDKIIKSGLVQKFIELLKSPNADTQSAATMVIKILAFGDAEQTAFIVNEGAVGPLMELLHSENLEVVIDVVWTLGNIAVTTPELRDLLINKGVIQLLVSIVLSRKEVALLRRISGALFQFCRDWRRPTGHMRLLCQRQMLPGLVRLIKADDTETVSLACQTIGMLSDGIHEEAEEIWKLVPRLVQLLDSSEYKVYKWALSAIANIISENHFETQYTLPTRPLIAAVGRLLQSPHIDIAEEAVWTIASIVTDHVMTHINAVVEEDLIPILVSLTQSGDQAHGNSLGRDKQAGRALAHIALGGNIKHKLILVQNGAIPAIWTTLKRNRYEQFSAVLAMTIEGLEYIWRQCITAWRYITIM